MRVRSGIAFLLAALPALASASSESGDYCVIPKLTLGVPTTIEVSYIEKPFCGMAMIEKRYVRMSELSKAVEEGTPECSSETFCTKTMRFYLDEAKATTPYILIFHGPRHRRPT